MNWWRITVTIRSLRIASAACLPKVTDSPYWLPTQESNLANFRLTDGHLHLACFVGNDSLRRNAIGWSRTQHPIFLHRRLGAQELLLPI